MGARSERARRPFWLHQAAEYLLGLVLVLQGLQMPEPAVPSAAGALVLVNAATARGPIGAFRLQSRAVHRVADMVVIGVLLVVAALPFVPLDNASRGLMAVVALVLAVVWWYTDYDERAARRARRTAQAGPRSEEIGRSAGRAAGNLVNEWKRRNG